MTQPESLDYYKAVAELATYAADQEIESNANEAAAVFGSLGQLALTGQHRGEVDAWRETADYYDPGEITAKAELLRAYDERFAGPVAALRASLGTSDAPEPLARTGQVEVYVIEVEG